MVAPPPPPGYLPVADWRIRDVLAVFVAGLFGSILIAVVVTAAGADVLEPLSFSFIFGGQAAASFLVVWFLSRQRGTGSLARHSPKLGVVSQVLGHHLPRSRHHPI